MKKKRQQELIQMFIDHEHELSGSTKSQASLARAWNLSEMVVSQYANGKKEIPLWRIVWAMNRYKLDCQLMCDFLNAIYSPKILKECFENSAFSSSLVTL